MTTPRHLWSGDWRRESAAAADELARRQAPGEEPDPPRPSPPEPSGPSATSRALTRLRSLPHRGTLLMALAMFVSAAVGYAAVSALVGGGGNRPRSAATSSVRLPAPVAAPGWLGVDAIGFPITGGALVVDVAPGSPADAAGLQPGDVITQIGNRPVQSPADLNAALAGMHPGQRVEIQYQQGPITNATEATLGVRPANAP